MNINLAIQLYTLRNVKQSFADILKKVRETGFDGVEFAGFHDYAPADLKTLLDSLGLTAEGSHTPYEQLQSDLPGVIEANRILGTGYIILPWYSAETRDEYLRLAEFCDKTGRAVREAGMEFLYHNHSGEFTLFDGKTGLELLAENTESGNLSFQLDVYWAQYAGFDPTEYMKKLGGRCRTVHLKDMAGPEKRMTEVGTGIVDIRGVIAQGREMGLPWFTLEQDNVYMDEYESIGISCRNIRDIASGI